MKNVVLKQKIIIHFVKNIQSKFYNIKNNNFKFILYLN